MANSYINRLLEINSDSGSTPIIVNPTDLGPGGLAGDFSNACAEIQVYTLRSLFSDVGGAQIDIGDSPDGITWDHQTGAALEYARMASSWHDALTDIYNVLNGAANFLTKASLAYQSADDAALPTSTVQNLQAQDIKLSVAQQEQDKYQAFQKLSQDDQMMAQDGWNNDLEWKSISDIEKPK